MTKKCGPEYEGWTNQETFNFSIWLGVECFWSDIQWIIENEERSDQLRTMAQTLEDALDSLLERMEVVTGNPDQDFIYSQVAVTGRHINFKELARHYLDSYIEQNMTCNVV